MVGRVFAVTENGYMALAPSRTKVEDTIAIFQWSPVPHILRATGDKESTYFLWGEAYVDGVMHGEAMGAEKTWFTLR
jgi:hypothetical protein